MYAEITVTRKTRAMECPIIRSFPVITVDGLVCVKFCPPLFSASRRGGRKFRRTLHVNAATILTPITIVILGLE